jgi:hypothetical protein
MKSHLTLVAILVLAGCASADPTPKPTTEPAPSNPTPTAKCAAYEVPAGTDLTKPTVSFKTQVFPFLTQTCGLSRSCHQSSSNNNGVFLGGTDTAAVRTAITSVPTPELGSMNFVAPGDPAKSYLMHKLDGDHCLFDAQCIDGSCQDRMPLSGQEADVSTRDMVRRWIAQGALDN